MSFHYSKPFESLLGNAKGANCALTSARVLIVGSGYGGAVAAYRLAAAEAGGRDHGVVVLERGREYALGEFPMSVEDLPGYARAVRNGRAQADSGEESLFDLRIGNGVDVLVGSGLGGTSLINANVAYRPTPEMLQRDGWPKGLQQEAMDPGSPLMKAFDQVEHWLTDTNLGGAEQLAQLPKFKAFSRYTGALKFDTGTAPIAVTLGPPGTEKVNAAGVKQKVCTHCGNCVTGCNVGAKNTLAMNFIPAAHQQGAEFFTGAHVLRVFPNPTSGGPAWRVQVQATVRETRVRFDADYFIDADIVILSAGALGTTEILKRSERRFTLSQSLGFRFSTNGDGISLSFAENDPVEALGQNDQANPASPCGPTISAVAHGTTDTGEPFTLEDGSMPAGLIDTLAEVITTTAQAGRLGWNKLPGWFRRRGPERPDVLAAHREALRRSQVFLIMGDDGSRGQLKFNGEASDREQIWNRVVPTWAPPLNSEDPSPILSRIEAVLSKHDRGKKMNEGQYVHNPLYQLVPASATSAMKGVFPGGRLLSVHPLGGCVMADCGLSGVVNDRGQIFSGDDVAVHPGLYAMDGSIVPRALGINPFLTIAALAWRGCDAIAEQLSITAPPSAAVQPIDPPAVLFGAISSEPSRLVVSEQLVGRISGGNPKFRDALREFAQRHGKQIDAGRWIEQDVMVLKLVTKPFALTELERHGGEIPVAVELHDNPVAGALAARTHSYGVPSDQLNAKTLVASGTGTMTFMTPAYPNNWLQAVGRTLRSFGAYLARRESLRMMVLAQLKNAGKGGESPVATLRALINVAAMHSTYREFRYRLELGGGPIDKPTMRIEGTKRVAWRNDNRRMWDALTHFDAEISVSNSYRVGKGAFTVDMDNLMGDGLIRINQGDSVPGGAITCLGFGARMARAILQAGFWEFGAPDYPKKPVPRHPQLPPKLKGGAVLESHSFRVPRFICSNGQPKSHGASLDLMLHCYRASQIKRSPPILLIHGLAQGSLIYAHPAQPVSMADYFVEQGLDVWLLDYRLSNQFDNDQVPYENWSIDEIGAFDVPMAVSKLLAQYGKGVKLHIFAHCVGAIATTMAILTGRISREQIASVAFNAIHPWTIASPANRVRANLGVFVRDWLTDEFFDPIVPSWNEADATRSLSDRLAFSLARMGELRGEYPRIDDERHTLGSGRAMSNAICDRMTFLYGRMWEHRNVEHFHEHWKDLVGRAPGSVQRHLYYMLVHGRVADHEGVNSYLRSDCLKNWQGIRTLFMHGEDSEVFNPQSASNSAVRLRRVFSELSGGADKTPVRLKRIQGYGHMDPILAFTAQNDSFPYLLNFFYGHFDEGNVFENLNLDELQPDDKRMQDAHRKLTAGPVLRAARIQGENLVVRLWAELPSDNTTPTRDLSIHPQPSNVADIAVPYTEEQYKGEQCKSEQYKSEQYKSEQYKWKQYKWVDVTMPVSRYREISVLAGVATPMAMPAVKPGEAVRATWLKRLLGRHSDCHFLVGSCRYPGTPFDRSSADQAFDGMLKLLNSHTPVDLLFLIGDQIYADATAGLSDPTVWRDRYTARYQNMLHSPSVQAVLNKVPCHFAIDDHEFADNFAGVVEGLSPGRELQNLKEGGIGKAQFQFARRAASEYLDSGRSTSAFGISGVPQREDQPTFWYALDDQAEIRCPAFILDTRAERQRARKSAPARLMSDEQMDALMSWLDAHSNDGRPKFIFMGSPIIPLTSDFDNPGMWMRQDGPTGYPNELARIVDKIAGQGIERVVFLAGDPHLSCTARMTMRIVGGRADSLHVVSSGLYAPLPFANMQPGDVDWNVPTRISLPGCQIDFTPELLFPTPNSNVACVPPHFLRVSATPNDPGPTWTIRIEAYGSAATVLSHVTYTL